MDFEPQNQKQTEALEFASQLAALLNEGIANGNLNREYTLRYATNETLINYSLNTAGQGIHPDTYQISKL